MRGATPMERRCAGRSEGRRLIAEATRLRRMRQERSTRISFTAQGLGGRGNAFGSTAVAHPFPQFGNGGPLGKAANLLEEKVGKGHPGQRSLRLDRPMQAIGHVAYLNHLGHVLSINACA